MQRRPRGYCSERRLHKPERLQTYFGPTEFMPPIRLSNVLFLVMCLDQTKIV
jgi:hypothetical protein